MGSKPVDPVEPPLKPPVECTGLDFIKTGPGSTECGKGARIDGKTYVRGSIVLDDKSVLVPTSKIRDAVVHIGQNCHFYLSTLFVGNVQIGSNNRVGIDVTFRSAIVGNSCIIGDHTTVAGTIRNNVVIHDSSAIHSGCDCRQYGHYWTRGHGRSRQRDRR